MLMHRDMCIVRRKCFVGDNCQGEEVKFCKFRCDIYVDSIEKLMHFVSITFLNTSMSASASEDRMEMPALLIRMSIPPNCSIVELINKVQKKQKHNLLLLFLFYQAK